MTSVDSPGVAKDPPPASQVSELVHEGTTYYVVGTAHVSQRSIDEVREVIERVKPEVVCVELDKIRFDDLTGDSAFRELDVLKVVREGRTLYLLAYLALASYQRRMGLTLGVKPGAEMVAAVNAANERGIQVELIDRDINITLKRTWSNLGPWKRAVLLRSLIGGGARGAALRALERLREPKALSQMLSELSRVAPEIKRPLIDERDQYLASKAVEAGNGKQRVVVVVGAAHVPGIKQNFGAQVDRAQLEQLSPRSLTSRMSRWLVPALFLAAMVWGWRGSETTSLSQMVLAWILPTSIGAGAFTLIARGSLLSVIVALVVAPVAAIHPLLGTGMVVGVVEAWRRRPSVADCERLPEDIQSWRGFRKNPVTRILLIAAASHIGTGVGFWVGLGWIGSLLAG